MSRRKLLLFFVGLAIATVCGACRPGPIQNLRLAWQGEPAKPATDASVAQALASVPVAVFLRDVRTDPTAVGSFQENGFIVRTSDNVGQYCADHIAALLASAGAQLGESAAMALDAELLEYHVVEGDRFQANVQLRFSLRQGADSVLWSASYVGTASRWGRTHNPENFNEALTAGLTDAVAQLLKDHTFGEALASAPSAPVEPAAPSAPAAPVAPAAPPAPPGS